MYSCVTCTKKTRNMTMMITNVMHTCKILKLLGKYLCAKLYISSFVLSVSNESFLFCHVVHRLKSPQSALFLLKNYDLWWDGYSSDIFL